MRWFTVFSTLLLFGCTTIGHDVTKGIEEIKTGRGIVLFSTGALETSITNSAQLMLVNGNSLKWYDRVILDINFPKKFHFEEVNGQVRSLELPVGEYYFTVSSGNPYLDMVEAPVYRFMVKENEISYLGEYFVSGSYITWSIDQLKRDMSFFIANNPSLAEIPVNVQNTTTDILHEDFETKGIIFGMP